MRGSYKILIDDLIRLNKHLKIEFDSNKKKIQKHKDKFYWNLYHTIREKHFIQIREYCSDILSVNTIIVSLINAYKIADKNDVDPVLFLWEHREFVYTVELQFKSFKDYNKFPKKHFLHDEYGVYYEKLRSKLHKLIHTSSARSYTNSNAEYNTNNIPSDIKKYINILELTNDNIDIISIKRQYKALARKHHPDKGGSVAKMQEVNNAYKKIKEYYQIQGA